MLADLLALPIIGGLVILQSAVFSRLTLVNGSGDIILLTMIAWALHERVKSAFSWTIIAGLLVGWVSGLPLLLPLLGYGVSVALARLLRRQVWQVPILAMLMMTFVGTLIFHGLTIAFLQLEGVPLSWEESLTMVTLPSLLLNLLFALPIYALVNDFASWLFPERNL